MNGGSLMAREGNAMQKVEKKEKLLIPAQVASLFRVDAKTVTRWARTGLIGYDKTLGGHHRFEKEEVAALLKSKYTRGILAQRLAELEELTRPKGKP